jgi:hypothetical protein
VTEAAVGDSQGATKGPRRLTRLLARKKRAAPAEAAPAAVPAGYKPFSRKLAPGLIALGALFSVAGALGAWIRTSRVVTEGLPEEQVRAVMGHEADWGRLMAVVAGVAFLSAIVWVRRNLILKLASVAVCIAMIVLTVWRLPIIDDQAAGLAFQARTGPIEFVSFHAGFGWGAWCLVIGAVALFLGVSAGVLRELDVRRGIAE